MVGQCAVLGVDECLAHECDDAHVRSWVGAVAPPAAIEAHHLPSACLVGWWIAEGVVFEVGCGGDDGGPASEDAGVGGDHGSGEAHLAEGFGSV